MPKFYLAGVDSSETGNAMGNAALYIVHSLAEINGGLVTLMLRMIFSSQAGKDLESVLHHFQSSVAFNLLPVNLHQFLNTYLSHVALWILAAGFSKFLVVLIMHASSSDTGNELGL